MALSGGPEWQQAFEQIKWEVILRPAWAGQDVKNVLYVSAPPGASLCNPAPASAGWG